MSEGETMGRCRKQIEESYTHNRNCVPRYAWITADAIDRLAADVAAVKAKVDAVSPEDVRHFVEAEKAWVKLVEEQRDEAIRQLDQARRDLDGAVRGNTRLTNDVAALRARVAEAEKLLAESSQQQPTAAPQPAAPPAGWLTEREQHALRHILAADVEPAIRSILARAGSPPVVVLPTVFARSLLGDELVALQQVKDSLDKAGVSWREVPRGQDLK